jgi:hypothetical protein
MRVVGIGGVAVAIFLAGAATAVTPILGAQTPVRDGPAASAQARGTSAVAGIVLSAEAVPQPLSRAIVTIAGPGLISARSAITDETGRFAVTGLPAGAYTVTGRKAAFIDGAYGATRPGRPGTPIVIAAGQRADVRVFLARGGVVTGTIRDDVGRPRANVLVGAINTRTTRLDQFFSSVPHARTDDRGVYRVFGLTPGDYVIAAFQRPRGTGDIGRRRAAEIDDLLAELSRRDKATPSRAPTLVGQPPTTQVDSRRSSAPLPAAEGATLAPAYYPGVSVFSQAESVRIAAGEVRTGLDFAFAPIRTTTIEGQVVETSGATIVGIDLTIDSEGQRATGSLGANITLATPPGPDGVFKYTSVAPGRYTIVARARTSTAPPAPAGRGGGSVVTPNAPGAPAGAYLFAVADIDVTGTPIRGLTLTLRPGVTARGRVVFDGVEAAVSVDVTKVRVLLEQPGSNAMDTPRRAGPIFGSVPPPAIARDGTFAATNVAPGVYAARALMPADAPAGWWLRSITSGGRDLLDVPLTVGGQDLGDLVVTFSNRHSELAGTLQAPGGQPAPDHHVVVFTTDRSLWRAGARRVRVTRPDTQGRFSVGDLPAGEYHIAALTDVADGEWNEVSFLETLAGASIRVVVRDGARTVQDIRFVR